MFQRQIRSEDMAVKISADEAAGLIQDGDVVVFAADGLVSFPNEIVDAAERRFLREGHPAGITSLRAAGMGNFIDTGEHGWCHKGMLTRSISSYLSVCPKLCRMVEDDEVQGYMFPLGPLMQLFQEVGRGMPEYLFYKSPGMNVALLRGTSADEHGNISCEREAIDLELLSVAQAVKASGGTVICRWRKSYPFTISIREW